jgi:hypothetical protein
VTPLGTVLLSRFLEQSNATPANDRCREISAALTEAGYLNERGAPFAAMSVRNMLA